MHNYEFRGDWFTAEDANERRYPHEIASDNVWADDLRSALDKAEQDYASGGEVVVVRSIWQVI